MASLNVDQKKLAIAVVSGAAIAYWGSDANTKVQGLAGNQTGMPAFAVQAVVYAAFVLGAELLADYLM
jgi:hypothetical protein